MEKRSAMVILMFTVLIGSIVCQKCDVTSLHRTIESLQKVLEYFRRHLTDMNLDGAVATRMCADQLKTIMDSKDILEHPVDVTIKLRNLMELADKITWSSQPFVLFNTNVEALNLVNLLKPGSWLMDYPKRHVNSKLMIPSRCAHSSFMENKSDSCISELFPDRLTGESCRISSSCWEMVTKPGFKDYALTHQLLYLQVGEMHGCGLKTKWLKGRHLWSFQDILCSNIYKDAVAISRANFPESHRDLIAEQIGLCGIIGYVDFWRRDWLDTIYGWQTKHGCFYHTRRWACTDTLREDPQLKRSKREDIFTSDGCSVHLSGVAALTMTIDIKFCLQHLAQERKQILYMNEIEN